MKIFVIALVLFLLNISVGIVDFLGIFPINLPIATQDPWKEEAKDVEDSEFVKSAVGEEGATNFNFGDVGKSINEFRNIVGRVVSIKQTFILFGIKEELAKLLALPVNFLYIIGLAQVIGNRGFKGMS